MSGLLTHSPADVLRRVLIALGLGTSPDTSPLGAWPVYAASEPDVPDECLTVYDTAGRDRGRLMIDGSRPELHGVQVRVRAATHKAGYTKARAIAVALDRDIYQEYVTLDGTEYFVHAVSRTSDVLALGKETPTSKRSVFTINGLLHVRLAS